jgi:hypothetical protein
MRILSSEGETGDVSGILDFQIRADCSSEPVKPLGTYPSPDFQVRAVLCAARFISQRHRKPEAQTVKVRIMIGNRS